ncbi:bifunctional phosphopantothenoylcysteine decarboxylase/phosphopantothenate--cysteine ligase CoaBC [Membranihabitans maritimus]|uniref:bifunctional phosphopantothenoylcysteine decarboxylase/phosphopantothenate--cysteine ligase CoaBC n=1 Tax=Membranihabitans maritimus TaxID=2904244 RepID=UPI001F01785D|nr:bifunctional phosphopantothenoylcysteine decarboxylase/phosphopantothenate--cysteine ligase CoaBC [Membranihabitans maritimus]
MKGEILKDKRILLGITGSIAAYKILLLIRDLRKAGAEVKVVMTPSAVEFITPLSVSTLSNNEVFHRISDGESWSNHVELGLWADIFVIAPCTANTLASMCTGRCDNMLLACYLSARCPVMAAPAMDLDMWAHPTTKRNIFQLEKDGVEIINVGYGELASGLTGNGRMAEPEKILRNIVVSLAHKQATFSGKKVLVTAGPTYESIDPVRFIGNWSSGRMGVSIAEAFFLHGAEVHLIAGPVQHFPEYEDIKVHSVVSAKEMYDKAVELWPEMDVGILAAAVADYTPGQYFEEKVKKKGGEWSIQLDRTKDIAHQLGKAKINNQILVGFALETSDEIKNAKSKLKKKNFDWIVLNSLNDQGAGFGHLTNKVTFLHANGKKELFDLKSKNEVALDIVMETEKRLQ